MKTSVEYSNLHILTLKEKVKQKNYHSMKIENIVCEFLHSNRREIVTRPQVLPHKTKVTNHFHFSTSNPISSSEASF